MLLRRSGLGQDLEESEFLIHLKFIEGLALKWRDSLISTTGGFQEDFGGPLGSWKSDWKHS